MSTRSGRRFKGSESDMVSERETTGVADVLKLLLDDKERCDKEVDDSMRVMQHQVEALEWLVMESGARTAAADDPVGYRRPKLTKLTDCDDIEAFLTTFETIMAVFGVDCRRWSYMLAPQLTGKAFRCYGGRHDQRLQCAEGRNP